jgi:hypothetical protein
MHNSYQVFFFMMTDARNGREVAADAKENSGQ